jgi:hypothetical protein
MAVQARTVRSNREILDKLLHLRDLGGEDQLWS